MSDHAIRITRQATGPRVHVLGARIHHGMTGSLLIAAGVALRNPPIVAVGVALCLHDLPDFPWVKDR